MTYSETGVGGTAATLVANEVTLLEPGTAVVKDFEAPGGEGTINEIKCGTVNNGGVLGNCASYFKIAGKGLPEQSFMGGGSGGELIVGGHASMKAQTYKVNIPVKGKFNATMGYDGDTGIEVDGTLTITYGN